MGIVVGFVLCLLISAGFFLVAFLINAWAEDHYKNVLSQKHSSIEDFLMSNGYILKYSSQRNYMRCRYIYRIEKHDGNSCYNSYDRHTDGAGMNSVEFYKNLLRAKKDPNYLKVFEEKCNKILQKHQEKIRKKHEL